MYLREMRIVNDGPLEDVAIDLRVDPNGRPLPLVAVGENGTGKTNLLSLIADALIEGASQHHTDVVAGGVGASRPWFRVVGGVTVRRGATGSFALLRFEHADTSHIYRQKGGSVPLDTIPEDLSASLREGASWSQDDSVKDFSLEEKLGRQIYSSGSYTFFPASRSEMPHWLNSESLPNTTFAVPMRIEGRLGRSMFVEHGINDLGQWIASVIIDSRAEFVPVSTDSVEPGGYTADTAGFVANLPTRQSLDKMLQIVLNDPEARFVWPGRRHGIGFVSARAGSILPLTVLSSGQATLLMVFGTVLMHGDAVAQGQPTNVEGICVIDEIDAHVHVDLANRAIPLLIKMFPRVQFITSAHSPLFVLGMQSLFEDEGFQLVEMPSGRSITAEGFGEFAHALDVLRGTQAFDELIVSRVRATREPLVLFEGETDPRYIKAAAEILGRTDVLEGITLDWIGQRSAQGGSVGSGKDNLNRVWQILTTNAELVGRPTLLVYDNDARKVDENNGDVSVRTMPSNLSNTVMEDGIENLLSPDVFTEEMYSINTKKGRSGTTVVTTTLNKIDLCAHMCDVKRDPQDFKEFHKALDIIQAWKDSLPHPQTHRTNLG